MLTGSYHEIYIATMTTPVHELVGSTWLVRVVALIACLLFYKLDAVVNDVTI